MSLNSTDTKQIRKFGLIALIFFGVLCGLGLWMGRLAAIYIFGFLAFLGLGFILIPSPLKPIYVVWLRIANFLGKIITTLVLSLAYYLVITPSGLLKRLFGGRPLPIKPDRDTSSYWIPRTEPAQPKERFLKRY
jgi:hypothetical protein